MRFAIAFLALMLAVSSANAQQPGLGLEPQVDGQTVPLDLRVRQSDLRSSGPVWWRDEINQLGTDYLRLHITVKSAGEGNAVLRIEGDDDGMLEYALDDTESGGFWTGVILGARAQLTLLSNDLPSGIDLAIDQLSYQAEVGAQYSVWGGLNETKQINDAAVPEVARELGTRVAKLTFQSGGRPRTCTGFLVRDDILLTNQHCLTGPEACSSMAVIFGFEYNLASRLRLGRQYRCAGFDASWTDVDLDAALIRLLGTPGAEYGTVSTFGDDPPPSAKLFVVQHPGGEAKQVSFIECGVLAVPAEGRQPDLDFTHTCDTAGGSSGAPVFDEVGRLVGLHHYGFNEGGESSWSDNRAVRFTLIRPWMEQRLGGT